MTEELLYTSAPRGLKPGSSGFCTVVSTHGMSAPLAQTLESLSGYRHLHPPGDPRSKSNPVVFSHLRVSTGGKTYSILSRVADYGLDYSQRTNKLAHHIVVDPRERPAAGPAWLLSQPGFMATSWDGEVHILPHGRPIPRGELSPAPCHTWEQITGDAGWAGVLAQSWLENPERLAFLRVEPDMPVLALIQEALALIPPARRWEVTFSTYTTTLPQNATCHWRCVLNGSKEANEARRFVHDLQLNLCQPLGMAPNIPATAAARSGQLLNTPARPASDTLQESETPEADEAHMGKPFRSDTSSHDSASETYRLQRSGSPPPPHLPPPVPTKKSSSRKHVWLMAGVSIAVVMLAAGGGVYLTFTTGPSRQIHEDNSPQEPMIKAPVAIQLPQRSADQPATPLIEVAEQPQKAGPPLNTVSAGEKENKPELTAVKRENTQPHSPALPPIPDPKHEDKQTEVTKSYSAPCHLDLVAGPHDLPGFNQEDKCHLYFWEPSPLPTISWEVNGNGTNSIEVFVIGGIDGSKKSTVASFSVSGNRLSIEGFDVAEGGSNALVRFCGVEVVSQSTGRSQLLIFAPPPVQDNKRKRLGQFTFARSWRSLAIRKITNQSLNIPLIVKSCELTIGSMNIPFLYSPQESSTYYLSKHKHENIKLVLKRMGGSNTQARVEIANPTSDDKRRQADKKDELVKEYNSAFDRVVGRFFPKDSAAMTYMSDYRALLRGGIPDEQIRKKVDKDRQEFESKLIDVEGDLRTEALMESMITLARGAGDDVYRYEQDVDELNRASEQFKKDNYQLRHISIGYYLSNSDRSHYVELLTVGSGSGNGGGMK